MAARLLIILRRKTRQVAQVIQTRSGRKSPAPIAVGGVITSYSIHYTKLYEFGQSIKL